MSKNQSAVMDGPIAMPVNGFLTLGLPGYVLKSVEALGFTTPTPIQEQAIPVALDGRDVVGIAQTGTGKTLAFALPMAARLQRGDVGLVLAPTRELAAQIEEDFQRLGARTVLLIGGAPMGKQIAGLRKGPDVIIATPGRLEDHLMQGTTNLRNVTVAVLDEADRMLDMGFAPAIRRILEKTPKHRQTLLFSATMPKEIAELAANYLNDPVRIEVTVQGTPNADVEQEIIVLPREKKHEMVVDLLHEHATGPGGTVLVFTRTRHGARKLARDVRDYGHTAAELHADRTLAQRREALHGFKTGVYRVLVATDIAARGIDVKEIGLVLNFDVPEHAEDYVHRIGRTGRAGAKGRAITMVTPEQSHEVRDIEKLLKAELPLSSRSPLELHRPAPTARREGGRPGGGSRRRR